MGELTECFLASEKSINMKITFEKINISQGTLSVMKFSFVHLLSLLTVFFFQHSVQICYEIVIDQ